MSLATLITTARVAKICAAPGMTASDILAAHQPANVCASPAGKETIVRNVSVQMPIFHLAPLETVRMFSISLRQITFIKTLQEPEAPSVFCFIHLVVSTVDNFLLHSVELCYRND